MKKILAVVVFALFVSAVFASDHEEQNWEYPKGNELICHIDYFFVEKGTLKTIEGRKTIKRLIALPQFGLDSVIAFKMAVAVYKNARDEIYCEWMAYRKNLEFQNKILEFTQKPAKYITDVYSTGDDKKDAELYYQIGGFIRYQADMLYGNGSNEAPIGFCISEMVVN